MTNASIEKWIDVACDYIDSKLAERYDVPITESPPPPILRDIASLLTSYYILRNIYTGQSPNSTDWLDAFKNEAYSKLSQLIGYDVASGTIKEGQKVMPLLASGGSVIARLSQHGIKSSTEDFKPTMNVGDIEDMEVDETRVQNERDKY